ncbi:MAG TPA: DNA methyltransferase, partial [Polyangiaceae bacterium]|nr:DNA methyltransferase [Polyangiaceae bacterium]
MNPSILSSDAKDALRKRIRALRERLLDTLAEAARSEYQLDVAPAKARLPEARRFRRERLEAWLDEQTRAIKGPKRAVDEARARFFAKAVEEAAHTLLNRLVFLRILEHHDVVRPHVVTGGFRSPGYAGEFLEYAGPLAQDDAKGYRALLGVVFDELALELPGLFGPVGLTALFPVPATVLRELADSLNDPALDTAWGDDTTLGWVYQYWNDPEREALDAKISGGGKIEPHEIASKTQMFTERYMVEWLLQNSLGLTWLAVCKKNGWTPDADAVLPDLDARRAVWRQKREAGDVALDALMPIAQGLESAWKYYVPQPLPADAVASAPASIADVKLLDPACGSGHFLVIAFGLFAAMYEEEARHRGVVWKAAEIAERIVANNLHGIDIDARAIQIAAAALWLKAILYAPDAHLARMNLVAPSFRLASLPKDDPARVAFADELFAIGVPRETSARLVESLAGVDHLGTLLRVDREIGALLDAAEEAEGPLFVHAAKKQRAKLDERVAAFLDAHAAESDLGLRLEGEQLAAGVRFIELVKEGK